MREASRSYLLRAIGAVLVCTFAAVAAHAQYRAGLQGSVTDPQGRVVPGANVTLTNNETNAVRKTTTNKNGVYTFNGLGPAQYSLTVEKSGFKKQTYGNVQVTGEEMNSFNVKLALGQASQSVTVSATSVPLINTSNASITGTITSQDIQALPSFGRDPLKLLRLAPGVFGNGAQSVGGGSQNLPGNAGPGGTGATSSIFQTENQVQIAAGGTRTSSNSFQIDGIGINSLAWGGASVITPSENSVKQVKVITNNYNAEYGGSNGAQIEIVSQNGTNHFHGNAFFMAHRPGLNAYQKWNGPNGAPTQRDSNRFNQFGGSLGGPIIHNKLFFFFAWETLRNDSTSYGQGWYETPQLLKEAPSGTIASKLLTFPGEGVSYDTIIQKSCADAGIANPALCQPVVNGSGKYMGLDVGSPLTTAVGTSDPGYVSPGNFGVGNGLDGIPDIMYVETTNPITNIDNQYNTRIDFQLSTRNLISFSMYLVPVTSTFYNGPVRPANFWNHHGFNHAEGAVWQHIFSPTMLNQARFGIHGWHWNEVNTNPQEPWGLPIDAIDGFGGVGLNFYGAPGPSVFDQKTYNFRDTLNWVKGSHSLTFGGNLSLERDLDSITYAARPTYNFRNLWDFVNDAPYQESANFNPQTGQPTSVTKHIHSSYLAFFAQDSYKMRPNLTLTYGLRWEYFGPVSETDGNISNPVLGALPDPLTNLALKVGGNLYTASKNNWGPQLGFAWSPNSLLGMGFNNRLVFRGGFGIGYNREEQAISLNGRFNPPFSTQLNLLGSNILYAVPGDVHQFNNWPSNANAVQTFSPAGLPTSGAPVTLNAIPQNLPTPVTYHYSLESQYLLGHNWVATIGYQGSQTRHYTRQNNLNFLYSPLNPMVQNLYYYSNDANASYNALLTQIEHRFSHSFDISAQYTYSKTTDEGSNSYFIGDYPFNVTYARGPADYNATNSFKLWGVWNPKFFTGTGLLHRALGGWQLSGILTFNTGFPWTPVYGNTGCNIIYQSSGYCNLRPATYLGGAGTNYSNSTFMHLNGNFPNGALAYFTVPTFTQGPAFPSNGPIPPPPGVGRNTFTGPGYFDTDMSLQKSFALPGMPFFGENAKFSIRGDFYNIFNKLNLNPGSLNTTISYDGTTSNPQFNEAQSALAGRVISLEGRFSF